MLYFYILCRVAKTYKFIMQPGNIYVVRKLIINREMPVLK